MKNKLNVFIALFIIIIFIDGTYGQQTPVFSSYNYNAVLINPAHAGYYSDTDIVMTTNGYFNSVDGSPKNFDISINTLSWSEKVGLAAGISHDQIGVTNTTSFFGSYSYKIKFDSDYKYGKWWAYDPNVISFGVTAGAMIYNENLTQLGLENDPEFQENVNSFTPTVGLGFLYNKDAIYFGVSAPNVLSSTFNSKNNTNLQNVYYSYFGYRFFTNRFEEVLINPSVLLKYVEGAPFQADFNLLVNYKNKLEFGGGYRSSNTLNLLAGFHLNENFRIICTYNKSFENVVIPDTFGLVLNYRFGDGFE
ncbi:type IX secretion system membrane protein, PorP/SprF family [Flavobacterium resistens]|uniref:Type IX secretion system membrane protein PorP/SprF n=1 Tax=Flavobacterium resistens TaxID=443612 RepID=A0A521F3B2_9FLAO|nr:type IX secretion system membrane protein PorP/SprF [Flavobacterium resistens]MRX69518.1 type IX secretion system membrane protein PorP/SprF [Flavobacterium resistens]SMO90698.1 type IX secretion system membrane protein, PorP/SprF family [Flavobacterium resistens]